MLKVNKNDSKKRYHAVVHDFIPVLARDDPEQHRDGLARRGEVGVPLRHIHIRHAHKHPHTNARKHTHTRFVLMPSTGRL